MTTNQRTVNITVRVSWRSVVDTGKKASNWVPLKPSISQNFIDAQHRTKGQGLETQIGKKRVDCFQI